MSREIKMVWITEGRAFEVVTCSAWTIDGATLIKAQLPFPIIDASALDCLGLQLLGASCALCVGCAMYLEHLTERVRFGAVVPGGVA